ncbi:hypothetical protein NKH77_45785 [Streptomyces sp. M19]
MTPELFATGYPLSGRREDVEEIGRSFRAGSRRSPLGRGSPSCTAGRRRPGGAPQLGRPGDSDRRYAGHVP